MEITILGSGIWIPTKQQNSPAYLIRISNSYILLDCGSGTLRRLIDINFNWQKINHLFISHTHPDHATELPAIIHTRKSNKKRPLHIYGPKNVEKFLNLIKTEMTTSYKPRDFKFHHLKDKKIKIKNFTVEAISVKHSKVIPANAYKFLINKKSMVYSGDLGPLINKNQFIKFCNKVDLLIADSGGDPGKPGGNHLNPYEIGLMAEKAKVKKLRF